MLSNSTWTRMVVANVVLHNYVGALAEHFAKKLSLDGEEGEPVPDFQPAIRGKLNRHVYAGSDLILHPQTNKTTPGQCTPDQRPRLLPAYNNTTRNSTWGCI